MPYRYPPEFRRRVLDLLAAGRSVASLSEDLGVSDQTIYNWRRQDLIDRGVEPGSTSAEQAELRAPRRRIRERVLEVSESGFYDWRSRPPSARSIRHAWLTDIICQVHQQSRGIYGARRVHAELTLGHGITVGHNAVAMLMPEVEQRVRVMQTQAAPAVA